MFNNLHAAVFINLTRRPELGLTYKEGEPIPLVISDGLSPDVKYDVTLATQKLVEIWNTMMEIAPHMRKSTLTPITVYMINDPWCFGIYLGLANMLHRLPDLIIVDGEQKVNLNSMIGDGTFAWNDGRHSR